MCGIVGALASAPIEPSLVERMRDRLDHRGPDDAGIWSSDDGRVSLGHRRLAIVDLRSDANQPFLSANGRFVLDFNGEIYNHAELRRELASDGVAFRTHCDTEVLVEAFARWGPDCLARLEGMFAFAVYDTRERRLFCARDRAGEKPLYYAVLPDAFLFASELKSLVLWPGFPREVSYEAVADFLTFGFVPDPKCIWSACRKLSPGQWMEVELTESGPHAKSPATYWEMEFDPDRSVDDWGDAIRDTLTAAARDMAYADVPVGTFLSGGVDSSSVTAALSRSQHAVRTFTIGFSENGYDERPFAREVAGLYRTNHTERLVQPGDVGSVLDRLLWHYDEPFNDYSYLPTYYVCREARQTVTVALSGDGGDEGFAGYGKYRRAAVRSAVDPLLRWPLGGLLAGTADLLLPEAANARKLARQYGREPSTMLRETLTTGLGRTRLEEVARGPLRRTLQGYSSGDVVSELLAAAPPREVGLVNAMRYLDLKLTLAGGILVKVDRASMAVSLEVRPVFLHPKMLALAARVPPERLARPRETKAALKAALEPWLPQSILGRPKAGFAMPLGTWLRSELSHLTASPGVDNPLDELIDRRYVEELASEHASGSSDRTAVLHSFMALRRWLERWL